MHLVAWEKVCNNKAHGCLGLRHLKDKNNAFMTKIKWGLITKKYALWVKVIRPKYKCGEDLVPKIN